MENYYSINIGHNALSHHGILGQKWGDRNGPPYPLDDGDYSSAEKRQMRREDRKDSRWVKRKSAKIYKATYKKSKSEIKKTDKELKKDSSSYLSNGQMSKTYINSYNKALANIMNQNVGDIEAPSGRVVRYVAKRGEIGVYTALADKSYNMDSVKNGVWDSGRIGYKQSSVEKW